MATTTSNLQFVLSAKDEASKVIKGVGSAVQGIGKGLTTFAKVSGVAFAAVGTAATAFGVQSLRAFSESEKEMAKFNATMKTLGKVGEQSKSKILEVSQAMVKMGFDDEQTANTLAMFMQRTKDVTKAQDLLQVSMDLSRQKGIDLAQASAMVNLVLSGNARALKAYGIELKDGQDPLKALAELQGKVAGQTQAFADTTAGKIQILSVTWQNFKESIGAALGEYAVPLLTKLTEWATSEQFSASVQRIVEQIGLLPEYFNTAKTAVLDWWASFMEATEWSRSFISEMMMPAILLLRDTFVGSWIQIKEAIEPVRPQLEQLGKILGGVLTVAIVAVGYAITGVVVALTTFVTFVTRAVFGVIELLTLKFEAMFQKIEEIKAAWQRLKDLMAKGISATISIFKKDKKDEDKESGKQFGGEVMMNHPYVVGEKGPEVFVPSQSGNIKQFGQMGGSTTVTVNFNNASVRSEGDLQMIVASVKKALRAENLYAEQGINV